MSNKFFSDIQEHSKYKHEILKQYLPVFRKIAKFWKEFIYVDGFAGPGKYDNDTDGSPILAIKSLDLLYKNKVLTQKCNVTCIFVEVNKQNFEKLKRNIKDLEFNEKNISVTCYKGKFETVFPKIKEKYEEFNKFPSLFFLDPYGYNQIPFWIYEEIFSFKKPEVMIIFMVNYIFRFLNDQTKYDTFCRVFGSDDWKDNFKKYCVAGISDKTEAISLFFQDLLKERTNAEYTNRYKIMHEKTNRRFYDIIHATTHFKGLEVMKNVMFNLGIPGTFEYHGKNEGILKANKTLDKFIKTSPQIKSIENWVVTFLKNKKSLTFNELKKIIYDNTAWIERQLREALKNLEKNKHIEINRITSKKTGISGDDIISLRFN